MTSAFPPVLFEEIGRDELNRCLVDWGHKMGAINRPNRGRSYGLVHGGKLVAVVSTDTLIRQRVAGFSRREAVELSRICAARPELCRVVLRLWRVFAFPELCAERGCRWSVSYQDAVQHRGDLYRFDGWVRIGQSRSGTDSRSGRRGRRKVIWGWCEDPDERRRRAQGLSGGQECSGLAIGDGRGGGCPHSIAGFEPAREGWKSSFNCITFLS